ncbi:HesA/MoeB/ThiF family protein [Pseudomonas sp. PSKL.D1]|uniref:HesA/MoeB/ThiF family protein n=1 Tax=Pseudomonas sp. PSKL.D1 TaxID=3029060 RepID=UPI0023812136|nr:ThiF family adenylyltransferase [Pseudomonas sp. PSKL.D1]WDY57531.1 ThiF family adenylyltransferase [Pseudomonas sp. PSKL.D1]
MEDLVYYVEGEVAGVVVPSTVFSYLDNRVFVNGPSGVFDATLNDDASFRQALIDAGSLVHGQTEEAAAIIDLLSDPRSSRTVSYLLCSAQQCTEVIEDMETLRRATVMVVGCGGIGSALCMLLAGAGVQNFLLVDADVVEESNLNRQLFWTLGDIGDKKVDVLKRELESRFKDVSVDCLASSVSIDELCKVAASGVDAAAITADNPPTLARECWRLAKAHNIPVVSGGYLHHLCCSIHVVPGDWQDIENASSLLEDERWFPLPSAIMPSYGPMNFSLASVLSGNLISSLAKHSLGVQKTTVLRWDSTGVTHLMDRR